MTVIETIPSSPPQTPKAYADYIAAEQKRWKQVIEKANIRAD